MTLLPVEPVRISYDPTWEEMYPVERAAVCQAPGCNEQHTVGHHVIRRSYTGNKPVPLVAIDGVVVQNVVRLCAWHHSKVDGGVGGHRARITWDNERGWLWHEKILAYDRQGHSVLVFGKGEPLCPVAEHWNRT